MLQVLFQGKASTFCAIVTTLFLVHPIHSEVVNNLKNRDEILSLIFATLAVISIFKGLDQKKGFLITCGVIFFLFSVLSKKSSIPFVAIIPLMTWYFRDFRLKKIVFISSIVLIGDFMMIVMEKTLINQKAIRIFNYVENPLFQMDFWARIPMFFYSNWFYFQKLLVPYPLGFYYGFNSIPLVGFGSWQFFLGLFLIAVGLFFAIKGFLNKSFVSFSILFFFLAIGGICNLLGPAVGIVAERFAFIASFGFITLLTYLIFQWRKIDYFNEIRLNKNLFLPLVIIIIPSFIYSINRNKAWESKKSLYLADSEYLKESAKANSLLAGEFLDEAYKLQPTSITNFDEMMQKVDSALIYYNRSISVYENYESNLNNRGTIYFSFYYDYCEALKSFKVSVLKNQNYYEGTLNIGNSYGKLAEVYANLEKVAILQIDVKPIGINNSKSDHIDEIVRKYGFHRTLSIINQFEFTAKEQFKNPFSANTVNLLTQFAMNAEKIDANLKKLDFGALVNQVMTFFFQNKVSPNLNLLDGIRKAVLKDIQNGTNLTDEAFAKKCLSLKKHYFDSSKVYFQKTINIKPNYPNTYKCAHDFALILNDLEYIIELEKKYISNFPNQYHSLQYIEIANSYNTLGDKENAKINFINAAIELQKERKALNGKKLKSSADQQRIDALKLELTRLKDYLIQLKLFSQNDINQLKEKLQ
jgi:hypothetical protein